MASRPSCRGSNRRTRARNRQKRSRKRPEGLLRKRLRGTRRWRARLPAHQVAGARSEQQFLLVSSLPGRGLPANMASDKGRPFAGKARGPTSGNRVAAGACRNRVKPLHPRGLNAGTVEKLRSNLTCSSVAGMVSRNGIKKQKSGKTLLSLDLVLCYVLTLVGKQEGFVVVAGFLAQPSASARSGESPRARE